MEVAIWTWSCRCDLKLKKNSEKSGTIFYRMIQWVAHEDGISCETRTLFVTSCRCLRTTSEKTRVGTYSAVIRRLMYRGPGRTSEQRAWCEICKSGINITRNNVWCNSLAFFHLVKAYCYYFSSVCSVHERQARVYLIVCTFPYV